MKLGRLEIKASRWPWQGYGWRPHKSKTPNPLLVAPLNAGSARFGAGWNYKIGVSIGGTTLLIDLLFGTIRIVWIAR